MEHVLSFPACDVAYLRYLPWQALFHAGKPAGANLKRILPEHREPWLSGKHHSSRLLTITHAYKLEPQLSNRSRRIFKVSAGSEQVTLVRERYRQDAASASLPTLNAFHFSLVWQAPEETRRHARPPLACWCRRIVRLFVRWVREEPHFLPRFSFVWRFGAFRINYRKTRLNEWIISPSEG